MRLATVYRDREAYPSALEFYIKAIKEFDELPRAKKEQISARVYLGNLYLRLKMTDACMAQYQKAEELSYRYQIHTYLPLLANNKAVLLEDAKAYEKAKTAYLQALALADSLADEANYINVLVNLGSAYFDVDMHDSSVYYSTKAQLKCMAIGDDDCVAKTLQNLGLVYEERHEYNKAFNAYHKGIAIAKSLEDPYLKQTFLQSLMLAHIKSKNTDSALVYFHKERTLYDTLVDLVIDETLQEQAIAYDVEQKEAELKLARAAKEHEELKNKSNRIIIYALCLLVAIAFIIAFLIFKLSREKQRAIELWVNQKNNEIDTLIRNQEIKTYSALLEGQEQERKRVAADLHDRVGGFLSAIKLQLEGKRAFDQAHISHVKEMLDESIGTVRAISHNLAEGKIEKVGLVQAVVDLKKLLLNSGKISVDLFLDRFPNTLDVSKEKELYKIVLELVSNTLKHAKANSITLQIYAQDKYLHFSFEDNGSGFKPETVKQGLGLNSIRQRVDKLGGTCNIDSSPNHGSTIIIELPLS